MRFGKIEYLNLLPFDIFIKSYKAPSFFKQSLFAHSSYPAKLNQSFLFKRIDAGFISSIAGIESQRNKNGKCATKSGIISKGAVWSVLVLKSSPKSDFQSDTSNALSKVLNISGEVLIGDKALKWLYQHCYQNPHNSTVCDKGNYIDMGEAWFSKHRLPFVFGRFCCAKKYADFYTRISAKFNSKPIKIPYFYLLHQSKKTEIPPRFIKEYLKHIYYKISTKEHCAILRFYRALRLKQIKPPKRKYHTNKHKN